jgi:DNA-binding MltR family transcriptional regulator
VSDEKENSRESAEAKERLRRLTTALTSFTEQFTKESDRAAVILVGARLDYLLGELLARFMLPNTAASDDLLDADRPLGTFSAKIHLAYRLGLIDAAFARALHILRRLRNTFAHETAGASFDHGPSRDRIRELAAPLARTKLFREIRLHFSEKSDITADFYVTAALLVGRLETAVHDVDRVEDQSWHLVPPEWLTGTPETGSKEEKTDKEGKK